MLSSNLSKTLWKSNIALYIFLSLTSLSAFASDNQPLENIANEFPIESLTKTDSERASVIIERFKNPVDKKRSCPLDSNNYKDIVSKIETIRNLFKDNCLDTDQSRLDAILTGAQSIQADLNTAGVAADSNQTVNDILNGNVPTGSDTSVSGEQIANVFNNINSIFINGKCDLEKGSFLVKTADVIQSFATMGMLVPNANGLVVAGGGLALSSMLRAIDAIFSDRFNFSDTNDRQTFIKLNCAFYDLRQDIGNSGLVDVSTDEHINFKIETEQLINKIEDKIKTIVNNKKAIEKSVIQRKESLVKEKMDKLIKLNGEIEKTLIQLNKRIIDTNGIPATAIKLSVINKLTNLYPTLKVELQNYFSSGLNSILILDEMLMSELVNLDYVDNAEAYQALLRQDVKTFENGFRANLIFHFMRIKEDISNSKQKIENDFMNNRQISGLSITKYLESLNKSSKEIIKKLVELNKPLTVSLKKLKNITSDRDFSSRDDGSENIVNILNQYDEISSQVYGKWGYEFLEYTTGESENKNDDFKKKFNKFADNHLGMATNDQGNEYYVIKNPTDLSELRIMYACQDAMPFRRIYKHADSLVQQGYDFIETNKRLFHSDTPQGFLGAKSKFRHIQMHHKSSIFAKKIIKGEVVSEEKIKKYINKTYGSKKKKYLGKMMINISNSRKKAALLQTVIDTYKCDTITMDEK